MIRKSLQLKFLLITTSLLIVLFSIGGYFVALRSIAQTRDLVTEGAKAFSSLATKPLGNAFHLYFDSGYTKFREITRDILALNHNIYRLQFIDVNGKILFDTDLMGETMYRAPMRNQVEKEILDRVLDNQENYVIDELRNKGEIREIFTPYFSDWGSHPFSIRYFVSYAAIKQNVSQVIFQTVLLFFTSFLIVAFLINFSVYQWIVSPILKVHKVAEKISRGEYGQRAEIKSKDEVGSLGRAINQMATKLEDDIARLKELDKLKDDFINIAAHNLKIPLNHLKFDLIALRNLLKSKLGKKEKGLIDDMETHYHKLQLLTEDLLNAASLREGKMIETIVAPVDLAKILKEVIESQHGNILRKQLIIEKKICSPALILGDYQKLVQLFATLIDNAITYSLKPKGKIKIVLDKKQDGFETQIQDEGVGIAKEELNKLFQKFYRAPSSAKYHPTGRGLGLYLAKLIVELHKGKIWVESELGKGTTFYVFLPKRH